MKFTTKEGSKAANGNYLFRIENVILVTSLHDAVSKRKEEEQRRERKKSQSFESILEQVCSNQEQPEICYSAIGYTKNGLAYHHVEKRREYVR